MPYDDVATTATVPLSPHSVGVRDGIPSLLILVVDDDALQRRLLFSMLRRAGHRVVEAVDGREGVHRFLETRPDVVLLDLFMPVMDGLEAARLIKEQCTDRFVPVIFLTGETDSAVLRKCVDIGGDDFLSKPAEATVLEAKITSLWRIRALHDEVVRHNILIAEQQAHLHAELLAAERIMRNITGRGYKDSACLRTRLSPMSLFNGDLVIAARTPDKALNVLVADFMGHGLPAAIGAIPASEVFYAMTAKGAGIDAIAVELNRKLRSVLGAGMFCAAVLLSLDNTRQVIEIWNAGLPDVLVIDGAVIKERFPSSRVSLGVMDVDRSYGATQSYHYSGSERVLVYTDGVIEARDVEGNLFDEECLARAIGRASDIVTAFDAIIEDLAVFKGAESNNDDTTLVELNPASEVFEIGEPPGAGRPRAGWGLRFEFMSEMIREVEPLNVVSDALVGVGVTASERFALLSVLSELFGNALDHGLLGLDSRIKDGPNGFVEFYELRSARLQNLDSGKISVDVRRESGTEDLVVIVEDTGPGFDISAIKACDGASHSMHGRGMSIVKSLCKDVRFLEPGNKVRAVISPVQL